MYIPRNKESELLKMLEFFPVVAVTGPRQVGKTTLVKHIQSSIPMPSVYIDLESTADYAMMEEAELYLMEQNDKCVIIDEVQRKLSLFPLLRSLVDKNRKPGRFILLGSASPELIRDSSESLAGRIAYVNLMSFTINELSFDFHLNKHWLFGGFPEIIVNDNPYFIQKWHENFIKTYVERDLPKLGLQTDPIKLERILRIVATLNGQILNYSTIARAVDFSVPTVKRLIDTLEHAYLISTLQPYFVNIGKRLVKSPKVYIRDSGILHHLLNILDFNQLISNSIVGASWEGYVIEQIRNNLDSSFGLYFYRTQDQSEVDLLIAKGNKIISCIEIKYSASPKLSKGNVVAMTDLQSQKNFIITPNSEDYQIRHETRVCSLKTFLEKYLPEL